MEDNMRLVALLFLCNLQNLCAADKVRLPERPVDVKPVILPDEVQPLNQDELFVIDSDVPLIIKQFPKGKINVELDTGPIKIKGKFIYGNGKKDTKTFNGKYVYQVSGLSDGRVDCIAIPEGVAVTNASLIEFTLQVATGTDPPKPDPPKPDPTSANPFNDDSFHVLIVYDTSKPLPATQISAMNGVAVETYIKSKGDSRIYAHTETGEHDVAVYAAAMKREKKSLPWIMVGKGKSGYEGPMPANTVDMLTLLKKYGG
jgi:hypothetical protein